MSVQCVRPKLTAEDLQHVHTTVTVILNRHLVTVSDAGDDVRNLVDRQDAKRALAGTRGSVVQLRYR